MASNLYQTSNTDNDHTPGNVTVATTPVSVDPGANLELW